MTRRITTALLVIALGGLLAASACKSDKDKEPEDEPKTEKQEDKPADYVEGWTRVEPSEIPDAQQPKLAQAQQAKREFGQTLIKTLTTAIGEGDYANAISVCNTDAPEIARKVSKDNNLEIGRTSFKLRNPDNAPPDWAEPFVDRKVDEHIILDGPGETVGYMMPIKMNELCTNCHGPSESLSDEVTAALAEKYPEDEATGFNEGDLRGWFWVRVD